jgi:hypothetical protein
LSSCFFYRSTESSNFAYVSSCSWDSSLSLLDFS